MAHVNALFGQKREVLGAFAKSRKATTSFFMSLIVAILLYSSCLSVRLPARNNSAPTGWIFMKFDI